MKDIRLVRDKDNNNSITNRDFAFIEFHSIEDSTMILERAKIDKIRIRGIPVFVSYSKFKRPE